MRHGDAPRQKDTGVKVMEMHQGRRPVYGGAPRTGADIQTETKSHGGSRGPLDPWSASTVSKRWDLWFFRSRKNNDATRRWQKEGRQVKKASKLQDHPAKSNKVKNSTCTPGEGREGNGAKAPKIVPQPAQTSKNPPFWWF